MDNIKYSVIVPTLNQSHKLKHCLDQLSFLSFDPGFFEVLVIDNGSSDDTKDVSMSFQGKIKNLFYHYCETPGLMAARHMGCDEAHGQILCYIDDDSLVDKDWLNGIDEAFKRKAVTLVGGPCIPKYDGTPPDWIEYFWNQTQYGRVHYFLSLVEFGDEVRFINPTYVFGCNYSIRKNIFLGLGGTHPDYYPEKYRYFIGDGESGLALKIKNAKLKAIYHPKTKIDHLIPSTRLTVDYFCWKRFYNGIHASYASVRRQYGVDDFVVQGKNSIIQRLLRRVKNLRDAKSRQEDSEDIKSIKKRIQESYESGYQYHQKEIMNNPVLLEWVLRKNYLAENSRLPIESRNI
jgi:glycosyltransferase involved in cell wall biosynthesis